jgi:hypothetical protein
MLKFNAKLGGFDKHKPFMTCKLKVKQSHYGPEQALMVPGGSRQSPQESGRLSARAYPPGNIPGTHFC